MVISTCGSCGYHCPINVNISEGKATKIRGVTNHPFTKGFLCPKGYQYLETVYHKDRVQSPLKRINSEWQTINWENVIAEIGLEIRQAIKEFGPESIAIVEGKGNGEWFDPHWIMARRFADIIRTPNYFSVQGVCWTSRAMAEIATFGAMVFPDLENAKHITLWGVNPSASFPPEAMKILEAVKHGSKLSIIDPRDIPLSKVASNHLRIKPGTDGILALGLINLLFKENWINWDFATQWIHGLEDLEKHVKQYDLEYTSKKTGIPVDQIYELAQSLGENQPGVIIPGEAPAHSMNGFQAFRGIHLLNALTANIDIEGGMIRGKRPPIRNLRQQGNLPTPRYGSDHFPFFSDFTEESQITLLEELLEQTPNKIKVLLIAGSNPLVTLPQGRKLATLIKTIKSIIVIDLFITKTAELANYILPACSSLERFGFVPYQIPEKPEAFLLFLRAPAISPIGESKPDWRIWQLLGQTLGYQKEFPWVTAEDLYRDFLVLDDMDAADLLSNPQGAYYSKSPNRILDEEYSFSTPSGKVEAYSNSTAKYGYSPLPIWRENQASDTESIEITQYPLILTTGPRNVAYTHSRERNIPALRKIAPKPYVLIHPVTAKKRSIQQNQGILVKNPYGEMQGIAVLTSRIRADTVIIPHGWADDANCNNLIPSDPNTFDQITGFPSFRVSCCEVHPDRE